MKTMAEVLLDHRISRTGHCACGDILLDMNPERIAEHVAAALAAAGYGPVKEAAAGALRDAADAREVDPAVGIEVFTADLRHRQWLRARAAAIEAEP